MSLTFGTQTILAERFARTDSASRSVASTSDITKMYINEGVREFAKKVHGIALETYLTVAPKFDIDTNYAIRFGIAGSKNALPSTDIPIASSTLSGATPTTVAAHIGSNVNAYVVAALGSGSVAIGWTASSWSFYVDGGATATTVQIAQPASLSYVDATDKIFGKVGTATSTFSGGFPEDCTIETTMPSGFLEMDRVEWDNNELVEAPFNLFLSPEISGTPIYYTVRNKKIRLSPVPDTQGMFHLFYRGHPTDLGVDGSSDSITCNLPEEMHYAPVYFAASKLLDENFDHDKSLYYQRLFFDACTDYKIREANQNPTLYPTVAPPPLPKVLGNVP